jgi:hypothetical protein
MKVAYEHAVANMEELKDKWLVPLKQSIQQISAKVCGQPAVCLQ